MLRRVTRKLHRLRLGTLDSFFAGLTRCFPLELGLPASARVMQEDETRQAMEEAMESLLARLASEQDRRSLELLTESFKQATFGSGEKTVDETLKQWANDGIVLWEDSVRQTSETRGWGEIHSDAGRGIRKADPLAWTLVLC
jgi:ATP-dependent helicase/nuclease subunit A